MQPFRQGLLQDRSIALSGVVADQVRRLLDSLCARVSELDAAVAADGERMSAWVEAVGRLDALVCGPDSGGRVLAGAEIQHALGSLESQWSAVRAAANASFIPARRGRIVLLAPRTGELPHAEPARAALENLARTLSVEWARFGITVVAIAPGPATSDDEVAQLIAFLCSPAGSYFSGCRFDLGLV